MKTFLISYDLGAPETHIDYSHLSQHIKNIFRLWAKPLKSVWIVKSEKTVSQIRDELKTMLDHNDKLIVVELSATWGTYNISKEVTDWMKNNI